MWLITYDVRNTRRLRQVHKYLSRIGHAIQYSVFVVDLNITEIEIAKQQLEQKADGEYDDIRIYGLPENIRGNWIGPLPRSDDVRIYGSAAATLAEKLAKNPLDKPKKET